MKPTVQRESVRKVRGGKEAAEGDEQREEGPERLKSIAGYTSVSWERSAPDGTKAQILEPPCISQSQYGQTGDESRAG